MNSVWADCNARLLVCNITFLLASVPFKFTLHSYKTVFGNYVSKPNFLIWVLFDF